MTPGHIVRPGCHFIYASSGDRLSAMESTFRECQSDSFLLGKKNRCFYNLEIVKRIPKEVRQGFKNLLKQKICKIWNAKVVFLQRKHHY